MRRFKLRYRILFFVLPVIVLFLVVGGVFSDQAAKTELTAQAVRQLTGVEASLVQALRSVVDQLKQDTYFVSRTPEAQNLVGYQELDMPREASATLANLRRFMTDFAQEAGDYLQMRYVDCQGRELVRIWKGKSLPERRTPDEALLKICKQTGPYRSADPGTTYLLGVRRLPEGGEKVLTAVRLVHGAFHLPNRPHKFVAWGLVVLDLDWSRFLDFFDRLKSAQVVIANDKGTILAHPQRGKILKRRLASIGLEQKTLAGPEGKPHSQRVNWEGTEYQAVAQLVELSPTLKWVVMVRTPLERILRPALQVGQIILAVTLVCVAAAIVAILWVSGIISRPIQRLASHTDILAGGDLSALVEIPRTAELATLAEALNRMAKDLSKHIAELQRTTAEKERLASELKIAAELQRSVLPAHPPEIQGWDLAGLTLPARETGGDFFDFLELPQDKLGFLVADVSGKGLPAALFMLTTRAVMRTLALAGLGPSQVLAKANRLVAADSGDSGMFVTLFYAELEPKTGRMLYANAGHNPPLLLLASGGIKELKRTGIPLGVLSEYAFGERELTLNQNEEMLLYTDGVTEAPDFQNAEFGLGRLRGLALDNKGLSAERLVEHVRNEVFSFAGDQPQFDDLTLMVVKRQKPEVPLSPDQEADDMTEKAEAFRMELPANLEALGKLAEFLDTKGSALGLPEAAVRALELAADEALTNVVSYAYSEEETGPVRVTLRRDKSWAHLIIEDEGKPFDPQTVHPPDLDAPLMERQVGGLGLYFIEKMMDKVERTREGKINRLVLSKRL